jgi:hypothetical protein
MKSSPNVTREQASSTNSGASCYLSQGQPDYGDVFASGISPLRPINPDEFEPSIPTARDSRNVIRDFGHDPWGEIETLVNDRNLDASEPSVTGDGHIFRGSARSVIYIIESIICTLPC